MTVAEDRLRAILAKVEPRIRKRFLDVIGLLKSDTDVNELAALLEAGRPDLALPGLEKAAGRIAKEIVGGYVHAAEETAKVIAKEAGGIVDFSATNTRAVAAMEANRLAHIRDFTQEQRALVRQVIADGLTTGANPREVARGIRDSIGLTPSQEQHVANYRRQLRAGDPAVFNRLLRDRRFDAATRRAIEEGKPLSTAQVDKMVGRYRDRYLKYRSEVIARTEGLRATHEGTEEMYRQAIDAGDIDPDKVVRTWVAARDTRTRASHRAMQGQQRAMGVPFTSGLGNSLRYPGDLMAPIEDTAQCRCVVTTRMLA